VFKKIIIAIICLVCTQVFSQQNPDIFSKFKSHFYKVDGYKINVEVLGEGAPIFFLPGGPGSSVSYMQAAFGHYYKTNTVVFVDFLGRGKSDDAKNANEYSVENDVALMEEIRKLLGYKKISLVGHSYGTVPAQAYAIKYPKTTDKVVLINGFHSGAMWQANCDSYNHYTKTHFPEKWKKIDSLRALGYVSSDAEFREVYGSVPTKYIYYHDTSVSAIRSKTKQRGFSLDVYVSMIGRDGDFDIAGSMVNQDYRKELKSITAKALVVAGRYDGVSTPEFAIQYKKFMPQAKFVMFENSGHNPYLEEPEKFYALFNDFMDIK